MADNTPGKSGPPAGSMNALKNGSRLRRLVVGDLPVKMIAIKRECLKYRRELEDEVVKAKGEITYTDAHAVDTAAAGTFQAAVCRWLLRNRIASMTVADIRSTTADLVKAKEKRDNAVRALQLDAKPEPLTLEQKIARLKITDVEG